MRGRSLLAMLAACGFSGGSGTPTPDGAIDAPAVDAALACPGDYVQLPLFGGAYRYVAVVKSWGDAQLDCVDDAGADGRATHLVVIDGPTEELAVIGGLLGGQSINDQWIGLTDLAAEGAFIFVTEQATVLIGAPTGNAANKDCVRLKNTGTREAKGCNETNKYVCECDGMPAQPLRYPNLPDGN